MQTNTTLPITPVMLYNMKDMKECGVVVPVYNEALGIKHFHESLLEALHGIGGRFAWHIVYVNDGSTDDTQAQLEKISKNKTASIVLVDFSRNFGKEAAVSAGLHKANELSLDCVVVIDADGQHPVTRIGSFIEKWRKGAEVVVGVRKNSQHESLVKRVGSKLFYRSMKSFTHIEIVPGSTDFRLIDKSVVTEFSKLTEHNRMTRGLIDWLGFRREYIEFDALERTHGQATYSIKKLVALAVNSYVSLSMVPLYLSGYLGMFFIVLSTLVGAFVIIEQYVFNDSLQLNVTGSAILGLLIVFLVGVILSSIGLLALYVSRTLEEAQGRPLYITRKRDD